MMIKTEFYKERKDGIKLYRTYSDRDFMIKKDGTEELYSEAIDVEGNGYTYVETDIPVERDESHESDDDTLESDITVSDTLAMLNELGVDTND